MSCLQDQLVAWLRAALELNPGCVLAMGTSGGADSSALCMRMAGRSPAAHPLGDP